MTTGRRRIHVTRDGDHWKAASEGAERASATGQTQAEVERRAEEIAGNAGGGEVEIHDRDGRIRDSDTVPGPRPEPAARHETLIEEPRRSGMVYELKRYLGNTNTVEVHDTDNEQTNCQLDEIKPEHRRWYDTLRDRVRVHGEQADAGLQLPTRCVELRDVEHHEPCPGSSSPRLTR